MSSKDAVLEFFSENAKFPLPANNDDLLSCRYLDKGIIDSLGIVLMVAHLEETLGIEFCAEDMQSYDFQTVGGLISIVDQKLAAKQ